MKGVEIEIVIWILVALFLLMVIAPISVTLVNDAQTSTQGCSMWASIISDISSGAVQFCE